MFVRFWREPPLFYDDQKRCLPHRNLLGCSNREFCSEQKNAACFYLNPVVHSVSIVYLSKTVFIVVVLSLSIPLAIHVSLLFVK